MTPYWTTFAKMLLDALNAGPVLDNDANIAFIHLWNWSNPARALPSIPPMPDELKQIQTRWEERLGKDEFSYILSGEPELDIVLVQLLEDAWSDLAAPTRTLLKSLVNNKPAFDCHLEALSGPVLI